jgi:hypothetical protein
MTDPTSSNKEKAIMKAEGNKKYFPAIAARNWLAAGWLDNCKWRFGNLQWPESLPVPLN